MQLELNEKEETFRRRLELLLFNLGTQRGGRWPIVRLSDYELRSPEFKPSEDARAQGYKTFSCSTQLTMKCKVWIIFEITKIG